MFHRNILWVEKHVYDLRSIGTLNLFANVLPTNCSYGTKVP